MMKAVAQDCVRPSELAIRADSHYKIMKPKMDDSSHEMQECFLKLKELVPTIPKRKISKTELLQHVIDYILDLELALDCHPVIQSALPQLASSRSPLSEKVEPNTMILGDATTEANLDVSSELRPPSK